MDIDVDTGDGDGLGSLVSLPSWLTVRSIRHSSPHPVLLKGGMVVTGPYSNCTLREEKTGLEFAAIVSPLVIALRGDVLPWSKIDQDSFMCYLLNKLFVP